MIKTRFCPSPTGLIHLGNARTALINALAAKDGVFLIRIEDTDKTRSYEAHTDALLSDLEWLGMHWQEGPGIEGDNGPYWQSKRQAIYEGYYSKLIEAGRAYSCYCSDEELALNRKIQLANNQPPRYPGTCRHLTEADRAEKEAEGIKPTLRFHMPEEEVIEFDDLVKGHQTFRAGEIGDFIIRRQDGSSPFMYANAIDDSLMGVTHALRGEDHLTNTPRQLGLLRVLGLREPTYGHISLILGQDGAPLSKRNGSRSVQDLREAGFLPKAVINYLARLGHYYADDSLMSLEMLQEQFGFDKLNSSSAKFDETQLNFWQKQAVLAASEVELRNWLPPELSDKIPDEKAGAFFKLVQENCVFPEEANRLYAIAFDREFALSQEAIDSVKTIAESAFLETALRSLEAHGSDYAELTNTIKETCQVKGKQLFKPLRLILTGEEHGPELATLLDLMGVEVAKARFEQVLRAW